MKTRIIVTIIVVALLTTVSCELSVDTESSLEGKVTNIFGESLPDITVRLDDKISVTNKEGEYFFGNLAPRDYTLMFYSEFYDTVTIPITILGHAAMRKDVILSKLGGITGKVVFAGLPVEGVKVTLRPIMKKTFTDKEGRYKFLNLESGDYVLYFEKEGFFSKMVNVRVENDRNGTVSIYLIKTLERDDLVPVSEGTFYMGHNPSCCTCRTDLHKVTLGNFYIGKYEVTHAEFVEFLNSFAVDSSGYYNGRKMIDLENENCAIRYENGEFYFHGSSIAETDNTPVVAVTWCGAAAYCNWLSEHEGLEKAYMISSVYCQINWDAHGYRLPTEAEWEYAARGGMLSRGYLYSGSDDIDYVAWYMFNSGDKLHPIGTKHPNELGIYDMSGNAEEWCNDYCGPDYYSHSPEYDPHGPYNAGTKIARGGYFYSTASPVYKRNNHGVLDAWEFLGFRIALQAH